MRKLLSFFLFLLVCCGIFQACSNSKTYADMLEDEKKAINRYIDENEITVISVSEFEKDTVTDLDKNEYVKFSNGVYMQIVDRGKEDGDTIKNRTTVTVRFMEYDMMNEDTTMASNLYDPSYVDVFYYTQSGTNVAGTFEQGRILYHYGTTQVPTGWLVPMRYIRDRARVKLIVPSKMGHTTAMQYVYPYFYDLRRIQFLK